MTGFGASEIKVSLTTWIQSYTVATDVLEYTLKYTFGKRILDKTRVQEKPWLA